jgi:tetratricopeptide (TPR) repeat protein
MRISGARLRLLLLLSLLVALPAYADEHPVLPEIDRDVAATHFKLGQSAYTNNQWAIALDEFEKARDVHPVPELDYNIAICLDRLERWTEAASAYQRFVDDTHNEDPAILKRIADLQARGQRKVAMTLPATAPPIYVHREIAAPIALASFALAAGIAGAALLGTAGHSLNAAQTGCSPGCDVPRIGYSIGAGYGLLAAAGVALVIDIPLWVHAYRRRPGEHR